MRELASYNREKLIDLLCERLTFERAGVKLYDRIILVMRTNGDEAVVPLIGTLQAQRAQEKEHEEWLEAQVRALGGSGHEQTEHARLVTRESAGIEEVVMRDAELPHLLHALLAAEVVDNTGWDLLLALADEAGDYVARREFERRLIEEQDHLALVRMAVQRLAASEVLGEELRLPLGPP